MNFPWRPRCLGSCFADGFLGIDWGFVVLGSCCLCSFLCSSLESVPCSYLYSWEPGYYSSNGERLMNYIVGCSALEGEDCSTGVVVVEGQRFRSFCCLRIHSGVRLLIEH